MFLFLLNDSMHALKVGSHVGGWISWWNREWYRWSTHNRKCFYTCKSKFSLW